MDIKSLKVINLVRIWIYNSTFVMRHGLILVSQVFLLICQSCRSESEAEIIQDCVCSSFLFLRFCFVRIIGQMSKTRGLTVALLPLKSE